VESLRVAVTAPKNVCGFAGVDVVCTIPVWASGNHFHVVMSTCLDIGMSVSSRGLQRQELANVLAAIAQYSEGEVDEVVGLPHCDTLHQKGTIGLLQRRPGHPVTSRCSGQR